MIASDAAIDEPDGASDALVAAVGKVSEALEWVERARGRLYDFHQMMGHAISCSVRRPRPSRVPCLTAFWTKALASRIEAGEGSERRLVNVVMAHDCPHSCCLKLGTRLRPYV